MQSGVNYLFEVLCSKNYTRTLGPSYWHVDTYLQYSPDSTAGSRGVVFFSVYLHTVDWIVGADVLLSPLPPRNLFCSTQAP